MVKWEDWMRLQILEASEHRASPEESRAGAKSVRRRSMGREAGWPLKGLRGRDLTTYVFSPHLKIHRLRKIHTILKY